MKALRQNHYSNLYCTVVFWACYTDNWHMESDALPPESANEVVATPIRHKDDTESSHGKSCFLYPFTSTKTEYDYLNGWIKKISPKMVNPRDIAGERRRRRMVNPRYIAENEEEEEEWWAPEIQLGKQKKKKPIYNNNNNNNNRTERRNSRLFTISSLRREPSPTRTLKWPGRDRVQTTCNTSSAHHVQHVVLRATWYEGTAQLLSLTELKSHLF